MTWLIATLLLAGCVALCAWYFEWTLVDDARLWLHKWSMRIQIVAAALTGWLTIDPNGVLWVWGAMPAPVRAMLPDNFERAIGAILFLLALATAASVQIRQRKLDTKRQEAGNGAA